MIFDYSDGNFIMPMGNSMGMDFDGNMHMRMGDNMSMDMETGDIHFTSSWKKDSDSKKGWSLFGNNDDSDD